MNGGVTEVAEIFLRPLPDGSYPEIPHTTAVQAQSHREFLRKTLVVFLDLCYQLISKARNILTPTLDSPKGANSNGVQIAAIVVNSGDSAARGMQLLC